MTRIAPTKPRSLYSRIAFFFTRRQLGKVPTSFSLLAHIPRMLDAVIGVERVLASVKGRDARLQKLACLRAAGRVGCPF